MNKINNVSDEAVKKATGKTWPQWLKALDAAGCRKMNHKQIVEVVNKKFKIGMWWQQMVTVGYEQVRGLRKVNEKVDGYSFNVSRTIAAPAMKIFDAWTDSKQLKRWMNGKKFEVTTATPARSLRIRWPDQTRVNVMLYPKGASKAQVVVEHGKLPSESAMTKMRKYWKAKIDVLEELLTS
jgi:hypothetical protein